jgi:hypothetical protein
VEVRRLLFAASIALWIPVLVVAARRHAPPPHAPAVQHAHERPWLSPEAAKQVVGERGELGPLFADVTLGGSAPSRDTRDRIAAFARANNVDIRFEVADDELRAVRFAVTYGGCCGYEGADGLARRLQRPRKYDCCDCPSPPDWYDDWNATIDDGTTARVHVHINRVEVRWEATATLPEVLDRAEQLIGMDKASVRAAAGDRWTELVPGVQYRLELPFKFGGGSERGDLGLRVTTERGRITEVAFATRDRIEDDVLHARWGRPHVSAETDAHTWRTHGRVITVDGDLAPTVVIAAR